MMKQLFCAGSASLLLAAVASAQTPAGGEFRVNTYTTSYQSYSRPAMELDGDFVVVWESLTQDGSQEGVFGQRFAASGAPRGSEFRINAYTTDRQRWPTVAVGSRGDFVVAWQSGNPAAQVEKLRALGLTVYFSEPRRIEDVATNIERLGELAGTSASARRSAAAFRAKQEQLQQRYRGRSPVTMFYQIWDKPMMTVNGAHIVSDVIRLCGGRNVFASLPVLAPTVDIEAVLAADPEAIVASGMNQEQPLWLRDWRRWPQLRAVRGNNLFFIPPDLLQRHTPRILEGAERLCRALDAARERR